MRLVFRVLCCVLFLPGMLTLSEVNFLKGVLVADILIYASEEGMWELSDMMESLLSVINSKDKCCL